MIGPEILFLPLALVVPGVPLYCLYRWVRKRWIDAGPERPARRTAIILAGALAVSSPYLLFKAIELPFVLSRIPDPLHVFWIDYRLEQSWGIGLPGDNETGFVIYRMTRRSAQWARNQGRNLPAMLPGGSRSWHPTPIAESDFDDRWTRHGGGPDPYGPPPNLKRYLARLGFLIPLEDGRDVDFNSAIRHPGSVYSYGPGGSITVIDAKREKIYFAYAG